MACGTNLLDAGGYGRVATTVQIKAVLLCNRYLINLHSAGRAGQRLTTCRAVIDENRAATPGGGSLLETYPRVSSGPLTELRLADVVDVDPDAADVALVDLDLVQIRGGMGVSPR
jgi:hypothetical protein